jgi:hypothetical protein
MQTVSITAKWNIDAEQNLAANVASFHDRSCATQCSWARPFSKQLPFHFMPQSRILAPLIKSRMSLSARFLQSSSNKAA